MKMMQGAFFLPCSNRSRTREAPTPTNISTKSEPEMEKNGTPASPATALASSVLPVPGEPIISTPLGMRPPSLLNFRSDEVGAGDGEERYARLTRHGLGQQRLARTRRAHHQHALGDASAELAELPIGRSRSRRWRRTVRPPHPPRPWPAASCPYPASPSSARPWGCVRRAC